MLVGVVGAWGAHGGMRRCEFPVKDMDFEAMYGVVRA